MRLSISLSFAVIAGLPILACSSHSATGTKVDGASSYGGSGGQLPATGGFAGPKLDGAAGATNPSASGGTMTGGAPGTGGLPSSGGNPGSGGVLATGGVPGTGGDRPPDGGQAVDANADDGAACSCASRVVSWDCYCSVADCSKTLDMYRPDGGLPTSVRAIREFADCNLVVVTYKFGLDPEISKVFDLTTGALVGDQMASDTPMNCPFGDSGTIGGLSAGRFPDATCTVSQCTVGPVGGAYCGTGGTGGSRLDGPVAGGSSGSGGAGGSGGVTGTSDAQASSCACNGSSMSLDCFCSVGGILYPCEPALSTFASPGGSPYSTLEEFADCDLVVVTTVGSVGTQMSVYENSSGNLVGRRFYSDSIERCPFDGTDTGSRVISAGRFPDPSCVQTSCTEGTQMIIVPCPRG